MTRPPYGYEWLRPPRGTDTIPLGALVLDRDTDRVGVLQDVTWLAENNGDPDRRPRLLAFLRPVEGGREWTADPSRIAPAPSPAIPG